MQKMYNLVNYAFGENSGASIYTEKQIHRVCKLLEKNKKSMTDISEMTGVSLDSVGRIRKKESWAHIATLYNIPPDYEKSVNTCYTKKDIKKVCELLQKGIYKKSEIVDKTGVKKSTINDILAGRRWKKISSDYDFSNFK